MLAWPPPALQFRSGGSPVECAALWSAPDAGIVTLRLGIVLSLPAVDFREEA